MIQTQATVVDIQHSPNKQVAFVYFKPDQIFSFEEGQFMFLERMGFVYPDGKVMKNAYSIGTTNTLLQEEGIVGTIVKKSSEGGMSEYLTQHIAVGDVIKITAPLGHFVDKKLSKNYVFISIGSGITPVYGIYSKLLGTGNFDRIINVFGERHIANIIPAIEQNYCSSDSRIEHMLYLSQEENPPDHWQKGYIQQSLEPIFERFVDENFQVFLCGKPTMVDDVVSIMLDRGVDKSFITMEKY